MGAVESAVIVWTECLLVWEKPYCYATIYTVVKLVVGLWV
jgi:hypothetical protein